MMDDKLNAKYADTDIEDVISIAMYDEQTLIALQAELAVANARIAELEAIIEDSAYSPIEIVSLEDAFDTLTDYFHDVLLWNEPEFVEGRAAVDTVRFTISENDKRIAELEAQLAKQRAMPEHEVIDDFGYPVTPVSPVKL